MVKVFRFSQYLVEAKSISDLPVRDERPMVEGIAGILRQVKDKRNRKQIALGQIEEFKKEGIVFDYPEFLRLCGL